MNIRAPIALMERRGINFDVPGEPRGKGRPRFVKATGRAYTPHETVAYESLVKMACRDAMAGAKPFAGPIGVTIAATLAMPASASRKRRAAMLAGQDRPTKKPDVDQLVKVALDSMNGVAYRDDAQVVFVQASKSWGEIPGLWVVVAELDA